MSNRKVTRVGADDALHIFADPPSVAGASHNYKVATKDAGANTFDALNSVIEFQNGPIKENGVNGITERILLEIVLDRLYAFQSGDYKCRENSIVITKLEEAIHWIDHRTAARVARGVEGTSIK